MQSIRKPKFESKKDLYRYINTRMVGMLSEESDWLANLCNASALLNLFLEEINWVGFYLRRGSDELILGPFQGKPACVRLYDGKGVCGTAAQNKQVQLVPDVNVFPGHVACDPDSQSEIVIPILVDNEVVAVLDIDSPVTGRFDKEDQHGLELIGKTLEKFINWKDRR